MRQKFVCVHLFIIFFLMQIFSGFSQVFQVDHLDEDYPEFNYPKIGIDQSGSFVITFFNQENGYPIGDYVAAQLFDKNGTPVEKSIIVSNKEFNQHPEITFYPDGKFLICWNNCTYSQPAINSTKNLSKVAEKWYYNGNFFRIYNKSGIPLTDEIKIPRFNDNYNSGIIFDKNSNLIFTGTNNDIFWQLYNSAGTPIGEHKIVNEQTKPGLFNPRISRDRSGNFVVCWGAPKRWSFSAPGDIYAQRFDANGNPLGNNFRINETDTSVFAADPNNDEASPGFALAVEPTGNFMITWCDRRNGRKDIYAQYYQKNGTPIGTNFQVNPENSSVHTQPTIAADEGGIFVIGWKNVEQATHIYTQKFIGNQKYGDVFQVSTNNEIKHQHPDVAMRDGKIYFTWSGSERIAYNVQQHIYGRLMNFYEGPNSITVKSPNGGENWYVGKEYPILWNADKFIGKVKIELSTNNGISWKDLTSGENTPNDGEYKFKPDIFKLSPKCLIRVSSIENPMVKDQSNAPFTILDDTERLSYIASMIPPELSEPIIDGDLSDSTWNKALVAQTLIKGGTPEEFSEYWNNFDDNQVTWKALWSEKTNLVYIAIEIQDDIAGLNDHAFPLFWQDDCVELYVDGDTSGGDYTTYENAQHWFIRRDNKFRLAFLNSEYTGSQIQSAIQQGQNGNWTLEIAMPIFDKFETIPHQLALGDVIGWDVWYDDSDNKVSESGKYVREHQVGWGYSGPANKNASNFHKLQLGPVLADWQMPIIVQTAEDSMVLYMGGANGATAGFDRQYDLLTPPPGQTYTTFFHIEETPNFLITDIRHWKEPFDSEITWSLRIVNAGDKTSNITWNPEFLPNEGAFSCTTSDVKLDMRNNEMVSVTGNATLYFKYWPSMIVESITYEFPAAGWYLISLPIRPENDGLSTLFPNALMAYAYNSQNQTYEAVTTLKPQSGYWLLVLNPGTVTISGIPVKKYSENYQTGWHLIGSVSDTMNFIEPNDNPDGAVICFYGWNSSKKQYEPVYPGETPQLIPGQGYWMAALNACEVTFDPGEPMDSSALQAKPPVNFINLQKTMPPAPPILSTASEIPAIPDNNILSYNYPNPFNPETTICYGLKTAGLTQIYIYNLMGQRIRTLLEMQQAAGLHQIRWDGRDDHGEMMSSGIYFYSIQSPEFSETKKMIMMK
ncbi:T9SS type A sorting domain-containing protein [candidate division KSB1 bacterium]|nr:T9SS type A sorting domain-containing protein [candidate division KSB1 bacterium]